MKNTDPSLALASAVDHGQQQDGVRAMEDGWDLLIAQAKIIAMLPLEQWLEDFSRAETLAPILDPTLYRTYIYDRDKKGERIQDLIRAALPLKRELLRLQSHFQSANAEQSQVLSTAEGSTSNKDRTSNKGSKE